MFLATARRSGALLEPAAEESLGTARRQCNVQDLPGLVRTGINAGLSSHFPPARREYQPGYQRGPTTRRPIARLPAAMLIRMAQAADPTTRQCARTAPYAAFGRQRRRRTTLGSRADSATAVAAVLAYLDTYDGIWTGAQPRR